MKHRSGSGEPGREPLVSVEMIREAVQEWDNCMAQNKDGTTDVRIRPRDLADWPESHVDAEPHLKEFLHDEILKTCGEMAILGACTTVVRDLRGEFRRLAELTVTLLRTGYGQLLADLLPYEDGRVRGDQDPDPCEGAPSNAN